jgi:DNA-directed RNA polymerase subunit RPC12/RpoP
MSTAFIVNFEDDELPCFSFLDGNKITCPMENEWHEGEARMCPECGWKILYDKQQRFDERGILKTVEK